MTSIRVRGRSSGHPARSPSGGGPLRRLILPLALAVAILLGVGGGVFLARILDIPSIYALEDYTPRLSTILFSTEGESIAEFASEKRIHLDYRSIPPVVKNAVLASEDSNFYSHTGIDPLSLARALILDVWHGRYVQGGSTLTQQLAKLLFLTPEKSIERKVKEAILATQIERHYTKDEIMGLYCNQICFDHAVFGIEMAARFYFSKPAAELELHEAALLMAIPRRPTAYSPIHNPERALKRRNWVLGRMREERLIGQEEYEAARERPLGLNVSEGANRLAPYFVEEVRKILEKRYGSGYPEMGLQVRTTLDARLQRAANRAVRDGLMHLSRRRGFRRITRTTADLGASRPEDYVSPGWREGIEPGEVYEGVVLASGPGGAKVRLGDRVYEAGAKSIEWTGRRSPGTVFRPGQVALFRVLRDERSGETWISLEQEPEMEAALVAIENATGQVKALVGGYSFQRSNFNRAVQALRQPGSAFKPILLAALLDNGFSLADTVVDEPTTFRDPATGVLYAPQNYRKEYYGTVTIRRMIEQSLNVAAVKLNARIGPDVTADYATRLGISSPIHPYLSLALGTSDVTPLELTSAYSTFPNQGVRMEPYFIRQVADAEGSADEEFRPRSHDALGPVTAYLVTAALEGVIQRGTARAALERVPGPKAGKTGTTDDYTDAWFVGFTPELTVGVWVGFNDKKSLGERMAGAVAALPIWIQFLEQVLDPQAAAASRFEPPPGVILAAVDRRTGLLASPGCGEVFVEAFREGTQPQRFCSPAFHSGSRDDRVD